MWGASSISWRSFSAFPVSNFPQIAPAQSGQRRHLSAQPRNDAASSDGDTTLFKSILDQDEVGDGRHLSGSDVLWALQRAAAQKKKKKRMTENKKKKMGSSSVGGNREGSPEDSSDDNNVKPLCIKDAWGRRLDDLEKRLKELSDT